MAERSGWQWFGGRSRRLAAALTLLLAAALGLVAAPATAQYLFGGPPQRGGGFFNNFPFFEPFQRRPPPRAPQPEQPRVDYSRAPAPESREEPPARTILVLGDSMADWLAYGLEDAFAETPDVGIVREVKPLSGLIRYQPKGEPADWAAAAKGILAQHSPEVIVVMLGLSDRVPIRETEKAGDDAGSDAAAPDEDAEAEQPQIMAPEKPARAAGGSAKFRDERWIELYGKKIDAMIAVLKSKGVPVVWVGLPAILGTRSTSDMLLLDSLYREAAARADITYVDVWDGFVDEAGRFTRQGPDFEGQIRRLRTPDGVFFTKPGARKLAHYAEREIQRLLAARSGPIALPTGPAAPEAATTPEGPAARPLVGPIVPLVAASVSPDQLLGAPGSRPLAVDALASRTLTKGEPLTPPAGRADDVVWPRREAALEKARGEAPVVATAPAAPVERAARPRPERTGPPPQAQATQPQGRRIYDGAPPGYAQRPPPRQMQRPMPPPLFDGPTNWLSDLFRR